MAVVTPIPKTQFIGADGVPLAGGKVYTYAAGTTTPQSTYTDSSGGTANTNPIILDSRGEANIWLGDAVYKFKLTDANNVEIWTVDNVAAPTTAVSPVLTGNVTISTDSSSPALKITQTGTGYALRVQDSVDPDATPFVITATGLVGIQTAAPAEALDIDNDGKLQFSASGTARTIISADATNSTIDVKSARNFVVKTNGSTYLTVSSAGVTTLGGNLTVSSGGATITGNSTVTGTFTSSSTLIGSNGLTVSAGGASITGNSTVTGTLTATSTLTAQNGLTVSAGGAGITGNSSVTGTLGATGTITSSAGDIVSTAGSVSAGTTVSAGTSISSGTTITAGSSVTATTSVITDTITERTGGAGVTVAGVVAKSSAIAGDYLRIASKTAQASTSGTSIPFTSIPTWARRITIMFYGVSLSGGDNLLIQIGPSGGVQTSSYLYACTRIDNTTPNTNTSTSGFVMYLAAATGSLYGSMTIHLVDPASYTYVASHISRTDNQIVTQGAGGTTLSGLMTQLRIITDGANSFDAGSINVLYE